MVLWIRGWVRGTTSGGGEGGTRNSSNAGTPPTGVGNDPGHGYREGTGKGQG